MIKEAIIKLVNKGDLSYDEAFAVMNEVMDGATTPTQNAAFLAALSTKNTRAETIEEISGCAAAMREHALRVTPPAGMDVLEVVGTGGDHAKTFNISTTSAIMLAAAGVNVAKHGNRAASSLCGAADCLEALGININQTPELCTRLLADVGICFMFAQKYHASMKYVGGIRKELGIRTVFNILGPLTNPAHPQLFLLGVYDEALLSPLAMVLSSLGVRSGMAVYGQDKMDELSISAPTSICQFRNGWTRTFTITPEECGLTRGRKEDVVGGTPAENAQITTDILTGKDTGPKRDAVLLNTAAGLMIAEKAKTFPEGVAMARELIASGAAARKLEDYKRASNA